jgi:hypothetical protein
LTSAFFSEGVVDFTRHLARSSAYGPATASVADTTTTEQTAQISATAFFTALLLST